jgi:hypothetical protein
LHAGGFPTDYPDEVMDWTVHSKACKISLLFPSSVSSLPWTSRMGTSFSAQENSGKTGLNQRCSSWWIKGTNEPALRTHLSRSHHDLKRFSMPSTRRGTSTAPVLQSFISNHALVMLLDQAPSVTYGVILSTAGISPGGWSTWLPRASCMAGR